MKYQLFPNLTADEFGALTDDIRERGVMVPVEVDENGDILDGHHRAMIADSLGIEYPKVIRSGWSEDQKLVHVTAMNVARRHLTREERADVHRQLRERGMSLRAIAAATGEARETVSRDVAGVPNGTPAVTGLDGKTYPAFRPRLDPQPYDYGQAPKWAPSPALMSSETAEWYTPRHVIAAVVEALGSIDLDPCAEPAKSVPAAKHFTATEDGLSRPWVGKVYMNPPYGREIGAWVDKLADEFEAGRVTEAVALVPSRTDTSWWAHLPSAMVCFITGRLAFSDGDNPAPFPSAVAYLGPSPERFAAAFLGLGLVYVRLETAAAA